MFKGFARFASTQFKARNRRLTAEMLDALPAEVQKDIGWKWSPRLRGNTAGGKLDFDLL